MQINFEEIFNLIRFPVTTMAFFSFIIWFLVDIYQIFRFEGKIKRGVKIWSKELTYDAWKYLSSLKEDVVEEEETLFSKYKSSFIRIQDRELLVYTNPKKFSSTWICVGFIDLNSPSPELEYRMSLAGIIFLIPLTILGVLFFMVSFYYYKKAIDFFIERKVSEFILQH